ncbi:methionine ABC transporter ATP-binding protein [Bacillus salipaludis]|uniref:methionine ABC transporter ATP-binding protein n=1 Tax=Bacillus salipaludis TaxID=2547811 RepID=UPI002E2347D8|nr:methionine ABC transporter ATP-binding protein [Bacillus salipaludis]
MIQLTNIKKLFKVGKTEVEAIKDVTLHVNKGEIFGIVGFSGAGKSTLLRIINLLEKPTSGRVIVDGKDLIKLNEKELRNTRKKIGMIFQHFNLLNTYTVFDNVAEILRMNRMPKQELKEKVEELLELVGLPDKVKQYPSQLSGGQKQRVGIARALAMDPKILLCDEATSALDPQTTESILDLLLDINKKLDLTIILVTHEMEVVQKLCDRVAVMEKGEIIEQGRVLDIFSLPKQETTKSFIKSVNDFSLPQEAVEKLKKFGHSFIVRIAFQGDIAFEPLLSSVSSHFSIQTNVVHGSISYMKGTPLGIMLIQISGDKEKTLQAIEYLQETGINVEIKMELNANKNLEVALK